MEDQNSQARDQQPNTGQPQPNKPAFLNHEKVIQPSEALKQEMAQNPEAYTRTPPPRPTSPVQATPPSTQPTSDYDPSRARTSAFSNTLHGDSQPSDPASSPKDEDKASSMNFSKGYNIGRSIFWFQFVVGIILNLVYSGFATYALKSASTTAIRISSLLYVLIEFFIAAYIPYYVLKSENVEEPFWVTIFGIAVEAVYLVVYVLIAGLVLRLFIKNLSLSITLVKIFQRGSIAIYVLVILASFIATYFLNKLSWGTAFLVFGKIKNKAIVKSIGICVIAFIVGGIAYHYLTVKNAEHKAEVEIGLAKGETTYQNNNNNSPSGALSDPLVSSYTHTTIKAHDFSLSLNFDPNYSATIRYIPPITNKGVTTPQKEDIYITGNELSTADKMTIDVTRLGTNSGGVNPASCSYNYGNGPVLQGENLQYYATVMGQKVAVCEFNEESTSETAYLQVGKIYYSVDFGTTVGLSPTYTNSIQSILSSIQVE